MGVIRCAYPVRGESHIQHNVNQEVATIHLDCKCLSHDLTLNPPKPKPKTETQNLKPKPKFKT